MTDEEVLDWAIKEYEKADTIDDKEEATFIRLRAKTIFDKRFPNPETCSCCGRLLI